MISSRRPIAPRRVAWAVRVIGVLVFTLGASGAQAQQNPLSDLLNRTLRNVLEGAPSQQSPQRPQPQRTERLDDLTYVQSAVNQAMEFGRTGTETRWENPTNGHHGVIVPTYTYRTSDGTPCREYKRTLVAGGRTTEYKSTACRTNQARWNMREERKVPSTSVARPWVPPGERAQPIPGEAKAQLINALEELERAVSAKIDSDIETTARAFWNAYDIEQSRRIADFVLAPLTVIEQAIGAIAFAKSAPEIVASLNRAESVLEIASLFMGIGQLQQVGQDLQLAMDGPTYSSLVESMLNEAAQSSVPGEYATTIKLHLYGIGGRQSPVWARHYLGEQAEMVWGARMVKRRISDQIRQLVQEISGREIAPNLETAEIAERLADVTRAIKQSKAGNVTLSLDATPVAEPSSIGTLQLGSIGALEQVRRQARDYYDSDLRMKQSVVVTSAIKAGVEATTLYVGYKSETGQLLAETHREVLTPVSVYQGTISKVYSTNARQQINGLPHEMLLALPMELSNTWMFVDETLDSIRSAHQRQVIGRVEKMEQPGEPTSESSRETPDLPQPTGAQPAPPAPGTVVLKVTKLEPSRGSPPSCFVHLGITNNTSYKFTDFYFPAGYKKGSFKVLDKDRDPTGQSVSFDFYGLTYPGETSERRASVKVPCKAIGALRYYPSDDPPSCTVKGGIRKSGTACGTLVVDPETVVSIDLVETPVTDAPSGPSQKRSEASDAARAGTDVTKFDILGLKLYMTHETVMHIMSKEHPSARITHLGKKPCAKDEITKINEGTEAPAESWTCMGRLDYWEDLAEEEGYAEGEGYKLELEFVEDIASGKSILLRITYSYKFNLFVNRHPDYDALKSRVMEKYGKPDKETDYSWSWGVVARDYRGRTYVDGQKYPFSKCMFPRPTYVNDKFLLSLHDDARLEEKSRERREFIEQNTRPKSLPRF